jgi:GMP synthase-like glutamine amidotransferase
MSEVGVVNMYGNDYKCKNLIKGVNLIGYIPHTLDGFKNTEEYIYEYIKASPIKHWIFSGSAHQVIHKESTQVPLKLLELENKKFFFICYSMESIYHQLKYKISERYVNKKETFNLKIDDDKISHYLFKGLTSPINFHRNHKWYFSNKEIKEPINHIASYKREIMIGTYKNSTLVQFHPERNAVGRKLIMNWIENK